MQIFTFTFCWVGKQVPYINILYMNIYKYMLIQKNGI